MNMSSTFRALLTMLASFFSAGEKVAKTLDNLATVAEETSGAYVDEARADRQSKIAARAIADAQTIAALESAAASSRRATKSTAAKEAVTA